MSKTFQPGDKIRFKDDYDGYFMLFKDMDLTVHEFYPKEDAIENAVIKIKEIIEYGEEFHLISVSHFIAIEH